MGPTVAGSPGPNPCSWPEMDRGGPREGQANQAMLDKARSAALFDRSPGLHATSPLSPQAQALYLYPWATPQEGNRDLTGSHGIPWAQPPGLNPHGIRWAQKEPRTRDQGGPRTRDQGPGTRESPDQCSGGSASSLRVLSRSSARGLDARSPPRPLLSRAAPAAPLSRCNSQSLRDRDQ